MLLVECNVLEQVKVIKEGTEGNSRLRLRGKFQQCDEQNNNGRIYPRKILEAQVQAIQEKIGDRSLVGALDHPANDAIHLSQASHVITGLSVDKDGSVIGECEILSTPNGKIVEALINDGVKIGISSRGVGSVTEGIKGKIVNEDFKLITFDLVSDPSTRGAFPELTESIRENSERAQAIVSKHKKDRVLLTLLENKINEATLSKKQKRIAKKRPPFDQIDADDLAALRNESSNDQPMMHPRTGKPYTATPAQVVARREYEASTKDPLRLKLLANQKPAGTKKSKKAPREDSSTDIRAAVIEAFKKVCWGDRYDERSEEAKMKRQIKKAGEEEEAKQNPNIEVEAATEPTRVGRYKRAMEKGGLAGARRAATRMRRQRGKPKIKSRLPQDPKKDLKKLTTGVKPIKTKGKEHLYRGLPKTFKGYGTSEPSSQKDSVELFGDIIRERCWKGYEPVKGKKPYSKGSCKKK